MLLLAPALVALSARRVCLTFLLLLLLLCIIFHTPKYRISYRIVPYRTRPDPTSAIALRRLSKEPQALSTSRPGFIQPPIPVCSSQLRLGEPPLMMTPQHCHGLSLWLFFHLLLLLLLSAQKKIKFKRPPTIWRNVNVPANVISLRRRRRCRLLLEEYSYSHSHSCLQSYYLHTL